RTKPATIGADRRRAGPTRPFGVARGLPAQFGQVESVRVALAVHDDQATPPGFQNVTYRDLAGQGDLPHRSPRAHVPDLDAGIFPLLNADNDLAPAVEESQEGDVRVLRGRGFVGRRRTEHGDVAGGEVHAREAVRRGTDQFLTRGGKGQRI